ncbi:phage tail protein [Pantoea sp. CCBC3-3-1]|uniref:phage tail protein n=1 Tax=Pantoea sp. CCBC3-3-1 TaxID=2490851 RepID=UPI0011BF4B1D|nr:phage tail protein [Pantoea sp. CCBC3-3-1]
MTNTVSTSLSKTQLLDYYYQRRAESSIGMGDRFELKSAVFGSSSLVTQNSSGTYDIADIPTKFALSDLTTQFATSDLTLSYADGVITLRAELDSSGLDANTSYPFNTLVVTDTAGLACMVLCVQEDSLYQGKTFVAVSNINTTVA